MRELLAQRAAHPARTVVLVPYAQLMPVARRHWAAAVPDGFAPRFETTMNWAGKSRLRARAPTTSPSTWGATCSRRAHGCTRPGSARARTCSRAGWWRRHGSWPVLAAAVVPAERQAWAARARTAAALGAEAQALQLEAAVGRIAVEWAAASAYATDALLRPELLARGRPARRDRGPGARPDRAVDRDDAGRAGPPAWLSTAMRRWARSRCTRRPIPRTRRKWPRRA